MSDHGASTDQNEVSLGILLLLSVFLMLQNVVTFTQNQFNCIMNKIGRG